MSPHLSHARLQPVLDERQEQCTGATLYRIRQADILTCSLNGFSRPVKRGRDAVTRLRVPAPPPASFRLLPLPGGLF